MLTTSSAQYLHPDYLQPLPTTLDAKKSPLALLAQTCSSIGKDTNPSKSIIPPLEKKGDSKSESPHVKPGSADGRKSQSSNNGDKRDGTPGSDKSGFRAPAPKDIPPLVPIPASSDRKSPVNGDRKSPKSPRDKEITSRASPSHTSSAGLAATSGAHSNSRISLSCGNLSLEVNHQEAALGVPKSIPSTISSHHTLGSRPEGLYAPHGLPPSIPGLPAHMPYFGHPTLDAASASHAYASSLAAHSHLGLSASHQKVPGASPYVAYARVKTTSGASTLVPICRDPYCTNCQITMQNAQLTSSAACGAGCTQCTHDKSLSVPTSLPSGLSTSSIGHIPVLPLGAGSLSSSFYSHAFGLAPGQHGGLPYICNWVAGSDYCGKRFNTSEELLQHLRTHTSSSDATAANIAALAAAGLPPYSLGGLTAPSLAGCHSHYSTPGSISPNSLRQSYPRTLSPNSILAASRYHPYKSPLSGLPAPPGAGLPGVPAALSAYYSPYSIYGQRIGAAVAP